MALTAERARGLLAYDPETGVLTWRVANKRCKPGLVAGGAWARGYLRVQVDGRHYSGHRLVWLIVNGRWPDHQLDHVNGVRDDNRIANLREATNAQNQQNRSRQRNNTSGHPGVVWRKSSKKWEARIKAGGRQKYIGVFADKDAAIAARVLAKAEAHTFSPSERVGGE